MRAVQTVLLVTAAAMAADPQALRPRDSAAAYPAHSEQRTLAIGAELLMPEQVHGAFASDLNRAYLVVEVGLFPFEQIDVSQLDFTLTPVDSQTVLRSTRPGVVATVLQKPSSPPRRPSAPGDVTVYPTIGIGYESGSVYDLLRDGGATADGRHRRVSPSPLAARADRLCRRRPRPPPIAV